MHERKGKIPLGEVMFTTAGIGVTGAIEHAVYTANNTAIDRGVFGALFTATAIGIYYAIKDVSPEEIAEKKRQKELKRKSRILKDFLPAILSSVTTLTSFAVAYKYGATIPTEVFSAYGPAADVVAGGLGYAARKRRTNPVIVRN